MQQKTIDDLIMKLECTREYGDALYCNDKTRQIVRDWLEAAQPRIGCWTCECGYSMPEPLQYCVKCDARRRVDRSDPIHKDWDTPEEDEAWKDL